VDGLTFVDHLIGHLMWPVIAIIVLVALYPVLRDRLSGLVRVKGAADPLRRDLGRLRGLGDAVDGRDRGGGANRSARHESDIAITKEQALDYGRLAAQMLTTIQHAVPSRPPAEEAERPTAPAPATAPTTEAPERSDDRRDDPTYDPVNSPS
jgi:hypothetical protein